MQRLLRALTAIVVALLFCCTSQAYAQSTMKALVVYDAPSSSGYAKLGMAYAIMLRNLLGHFDGTVDMIPVQNYTAGQVQNYSVMFYLGSHYDNPLPASFLQDAATTGKTVVWFRYNIWQLAWDPEYNFAARFGLDFTGLRGMNATPTSDNPSPGFFDTVLYKNREFVKYYAYDSDSGRINADPDVGVMQVVDTGKAASLSNVRNSVTNEQIPYLVRAGNFWYFADLPFSYIGPRDRYLVIADQLHDILNSGQQESHQAMVRLEDVDATVSVDNMKVLTDYLYRKNIPFSVAAIPYYTDPLGVYNGGIPVSIPLSQASDLKTSLNYALDKGGEVVQHGYTHQYASMRNPWTAVSADDFEFWDVVHNSPVPEDSTAWAAQRIKAGLNDLLANGYKPVAWEAPHYQMSPLSTKAVPPIYGKTYQRAVYYTSDAPDFTESQGKDFAAGQFFPYEIKQDYYGQNILPENLGNIEYDISAIDPSSTVVYTWQDIYTNAQFALAVRDGFASFFFHPFWLDPDLKLPAYKDFQSLVTGITNLGYKWTSPSRLP
ncbi:MAG TPA: DUF2334 domain-containing protein [Noviherbaspirillum sp.]